jgi:hypothetical protein
MRHKPSAQRFLLFYYTINRQDSSKKFNIANDFDHFKNFNPTSVLYRAIYSGGQTGRQRQLS